MGIFEHSVHNFFPTMYVTDQKETQKLKSGNRGKLVKFQHFWDEVKCQHTCGADTRCVTCYVKKIGSKRKIAFLDLEESKVTYRKLGFLS